MQHNKQNKKERNVLYTDKASNLDKNLQLYTKKTFMKINTVFQH